MNTKSRPVNGYVDVHSHFWSPEVDKPQGGRLVNNQRVKPLKGKQSNSWFKT